VAGLTQNTGASLRNRYDLTQGDLVQQIVDSLNATIDLAQAIVGNLSLSMGAIAKSHRGPVLCWLPVSFVVSIHWRPHR